tara:strand:- start:930 stop:2627 length:1698 start_codon:yes stop_codon:yes gene_type:complete
MERKVKWVINKAVNKEEALKLSIELNVDFIIAEMLVKRGIRTFDQSKQFFRPDSQYLHNPFLMKDMAIAVDRILLAINRKERILIYGDYDVDGITSVALMSDFLEGLGGIVSRYIPDRSEGYGLSTSAIEMAYDQNQSLIIALDCGIKAIDQSKVAINKGVDLIICDHHVPGNKLPSALAILNPKRKDCNYPFKELCGCGIGFKLIQAINERIGNDINGISEFYELVAIACAADIVPLVGENRVFTFLGLSQLNRNPREGLKLLINQRDKQEIKINDLLFHIAPRINATGRLANASIALSLLTLKNKYELRKIVKRVEELNTKRRDIEKSITNEALEQISKCDTCNHYSNVVFKKKWHKGVVGIVASRIVDRHYKPTIVFSESGSGKLTGSGRSIKGVNLLKILSNCEKYISKYGGHKYAAGLQIDENDLEKFIEKFDIECSKFVDYNLPSREISVEREICFESINPKFIRILNQFQPFGPSNQAPIFLSKNVEIAGVVQNVGKNNEHLKINVMQDTQNIFSAIGFNLSKKINEMDTSNFDIVYTIEENNWNGKKSIQLNIKDLK